MNMVINLIYWIHWANMNASYVAFALYLLLS